jgi:hypothetical protein
MITPLRSLLDRILTRRYPPLDERVARLAYHLAQPAACPDDAKVGHHRVQAPGPAHPQHGPAWATPTGVSLRLLHQAHAAHQVTAAREMDDSSARLVARSRRRVKARKAGVVAITERRRA